MTGDATLSPSLPLGFDLEYSLEGQRGDLSVREDGRDPPLLHTVSGGMYVIDSRFQVGLALGTFIGLEPIARTSLRRERLRSGTPRTHFGQMQMQYLW